VTIGLIALALFAPAVAVIAVRGILVDWIGTRS
jgi:hypothetical protein